MHPTLALLFTLQIYMLKFEQKIWHPPNQTKEYLVMKKLLFSVLTMIVAALFLPTMNSEVRAASCSPGSQQELHKLLINHSPFRGRWSYGSMSGPAEVSVKRDSFGNPYVHIRSSKKGTNQLLPPKQKTARFISSTDIVFQSNGSVRLRLYRNCSLAGTQNYTDGSLVKITLSPS